MRGASVRIQRLYSLFLPALIAVAIARHVIVKRDPFVGGHELAAVYLCIYLPMLAIGSGRFLPGPLLWACRIKMSQLLQSQDSLPRSNHLGLAQRNRKDAPTRLGAPSSRKQIQGRR